MHKIELHNVAITFDVVSRNILSKKTLIDRIASQFNRKYERIKALDEINLTIGKGERVGLIGLNGSGKSTLLKVVAGIYTPNKGERIVNGHINPLFELATGIEMEMTGWENIKIRALMLGMKKDEVTEKMHEIAEFSELGEFLNYPVKNYSSGMFMRLAFSVSMSIEPEILLLDEVVATGDAQFGLKAQNKLTELIEKGKILMVTSHNSDYLLNICNRIIWLEKGKVRMDGEPRKVVQIYQESIVV